MQIYGQYVVAYFHENCPVGKSFGTFNDIKAETHYFSMIL